MSVVWTSGRARLLATLLLVLALLAGIPSRAPAGPPKAQRVTGFAYHHSGRVLHAAVAAADQRLSVSLAQVAVPRLLRQGRSCQRTTGASAVASVSHELHLDVAVRLASGESGTYLLQPQGDGPHDRPERSLNLLLTRRGLATVASAHGRYAQRFLAAQRAARHGRRGIWACQPQSGGQRRGARVHGRLSSLQRLALTEPLSSFRRALGL